MYRLALLSSKIGCASSGSQIMTFCRDAQGCQIRQCSMPFQCAQLHVEQGSSCQKCLCPQSCDEREILPELLTHAYGAQTDTKDSAKLPRPSWVESMAFEARGLRQIPTESPGGGRVR